jgi:hypothetical protein
MGEMKRAISREVQERQDHDAKVRERFASTLVIAASIIAAVRLAREESIDRPSPRVVSAVSQSVALARMILDKIMRYGD